MLGIPGSALTGRWNNLGALSDEIGLFNGKCRIAASYVGGMRLPGNFVDRMWVGMGVTIYIWRQGISIRKPVSQRGQHIES